MFYVYSPNGVAQKKKIKNPWHGSQIRTIDNHEESKWHANFALQKCITALL